MNNDRMLRMALRENAAISGVSGLVLLLGAAWLDGWLGIDWWLLATVGVGLLVYAVDLAWVARDDRLLVPGARMAIAADVAWVLGAVALIAFTAVLTRRGEIALAVVSLVVAGLAAAQWVGLRRMTEDRAAV